MLLVTSLLSIISDNKYLNTQDSFRQYLGLIDHVCNLIDTYNNAMDIQGYKILA